MVEGELESIYFTDTKTGFAVGGQNILKTIDGGDNWNEILSGTANNLKSVFFINTDTGYIVGNKGTLLRTSDSGKNWLKSDISATINLTSIYFINKNVGFAVGDNILKTTDGGKTWNIISTTNAFSVCFINENVGFVGGVGGMILKTTGGVDIVPNLIVSNNSLSIASTSNSTKTFDITSNISWTTANDQTWLTVSSASGSNNATITLTAQANPTTGAYKKALK